MSHTVHLTDTKYSQLTIPHDAEKPGLRHQEFHRPSKRVLCIHILNLSVGPSMEMCARAIKRNEDVPLSRVVGQGHEGLDSPRVATCQFEPPGVRELHWATSCTCKLCRQPFCAWMQRPAESEIPVWPFWFGLRTYSIVR
jgi:hypothetical protein